MERTLAVADGCHRFLELHKRKANLFELMQQARHERLSLRIPAPSVVSVEIDAIQQVRLLFSEALILPGHIRRFTSHANKTIQAVRLRLLGRSDERASVHGP